MLIARPHTMLATFIESASEVSTSYCSFVSVGLLTVECRVF